MSEREGRPVLTAELQAFWIQQLQPLLKHQRLHMLALLSQRYGQAAVSRIAKVVCP